MLPSYSSWFVCLCVDRVVSFSLSGGIHPGPRAWTWMNVPHTCRRLLGAVQLTFTDSTGYRLTVSSRDQDVCIFVCMYAFSGLPLW